MLPRVYEECLADSDRQNPDASTGSFLWMAVEDCALEAMLQYLKSLQPSHFSLHFGGVRVSSDIEVTPEEACAAMSEAVMAHSGFAVHVALKSHRDFAACIAGAVTPPP